MCTVFVLALTYELARRRSSIVHICFLDSRSVLLIFSHRCWCTRCRRHWLLKLQPTRSSLSFLLCPFPLDLQTQLHYKLPCPSHPLPLRPARRQHGGLLHCTCVLTSSRPPPQVLVYFAVAKKGDKPTDGKTDVNPEGLTAGGRAHVG